MSDYLKTKALISSHVLRQKYFTENVKKLTCDFTAGTAIAGKPAILGTQSVNYKMVPLYCDAACTIPVGSATFNIVTLNIEDIHTINEKGIFSFTKREASGKIINSPTVQYEYSSSSNSNSVFFANLSSNTFRMDGYGTDGIHNLLNLFNVRLTINVSGNLRTVSFTGGNVANFSLLNEKQYYYTTDDFAYPGHPGRCNDYNYPARN